MIQIVMKKPALNIFIYAADAAKRPAFGLLAVPRRRRLDICSLNFFLRAALSDTLMELGTTSQLTRKLINQFTLHSSIAEGNSLSEVVPRSIIKCICVQ